MTVLSASKVALRGHDATILARWVSSWDADDSPRVGRRLIEGSNLTDEFAASQRLMNRLDEALEVIAQARSAGSMAEDDPED